MSRLRVLLLVEQLRRPVAGGIGTYALGLLQGLEELAETGADDAPELTLKASRAPRGAADPLAGLGYPLHTSALPGPLLTRGWDHGLVRAPSGVDVVHAVSLATLEPGPATLVVTVHDLLCAAFQTHIHPAADGGTRPPWPGR